MEFKCSCPQCQQHFIATEEHLGIEMSCPNCSKNFIVQKGEEIAPVNNEPFSASARHFEVVCDVEKGSSNPVVGFLKGTGLVILYIGGMILLWCVVLALLNGAVSVGARSFPWLIGTYGITLGICILLLPLLFFRGARKFVGTAYVCSSYIFGLATWVWSLLLAYAYWNWIGIIIGLLFMGVGVFPIALLACLFHGNWATSGELIGSGILIYVTRGLGVYFTAIGEKN